MGQYSFYPDYDSAKGVKLASVDAKVSYLEGRTRKLLLRPIGAVLSARRKNRALWDLNIGTCTLICDGISGLSTFYGQGSDGDRFKSFITDFMYPRRKQKSNFASIMWYQVRCSLSHGLYVENALIETDPQKHLKCSPGGKLIIDLESFFKDFERATGLFFGKLRVKKPPAMLARFERRFNQVFPDLV